MVPSKMRSRQGASRGALRIDPGGHAAVGHFRVVAGAVHLRIVLPFFGAGGGVERDDVVVRSREVEGAFHEDGGRFEGRFAVVAGRGFERAGVVGPGDLEARDVFDIERLRAEYGANQEENQTAHTRILHCGAGNANSAGTSRPNCGTSGSGGSR